MYRKAKEVSYCFSLLSSLTKIHSWGNIKTMGLCMSDFEVTTKSLIQFIIELWYSCDLSSIISGFYPVGEQGDSLQTFQLPSQTFKLPPLLFACYGDLLKKIVIVHIIT